MTQSTFIESQIIPTNFTNIRPQTSYKADTLRILMILKVLLSCDAIKVALIAYQRYALMEFRIGPFWGASSMPKQSNTYKRRLRDVQLLQKVCVLCPT